MDEIRYRNLKPDEILIPSDQMRRAWWTEASTYEWFDLPKFDVGKRAGDFAGSGFLLRRIVDNDL